MPDIYVGVIIGAVIASIFWLIVRIVRRPKTKGKLVVDLSGEGQPVSLDISHFDTMLTDHKVLLDFEVILPEEKEDEETK